MKQNQDRCDACGRFVEECGLYVEDGENGKPDRCICKRCDQAKQIGKSVTFQQAGNDHPLLTGVVVRAGETGIAVKVEGRIAQIVPLSAVVEIVQ